MPPAPFTFRFVVDASHDGLRIDTFLASCLRNHSSARLQRLARAGGVSVDDGPCPADRRVFRGEEITVRLAEPPDPLYPPESIPLETLYDDPWLLALNKPAGLIAHPVGPVGDGTIANAVQAIFDRETRHRGLLRPGIVHRLDRETSGVLLVAKDHSAHAGLTRSFERADVSKEYLALVARRIKPDSGTIDLPIGARPGSLLMSAKADAVAPRSAVTAFRVIERFRSSTLVALHPRSGRKHQIRVHLAAIGHPLLGDSSYGPEYGERQTSGHPNRHALHAVAITFRHPVTNAPLRIAAPVPPDFWDLLRIAPGVRTHH